jgi:hypothetical protein
VLEQARVFSKPGIAGAPTEIPCCKPFPPVFTAVLKKLFFTRFFTIFSAQNKAKPQLNTIYSIGGL